ncbi:MAG TPA: TfoX/Sxy family protein [Candidatus Saccharimonadales bacterium]|nr:TfoX/Sxy family protein [Candidatus Saccharimonadales bacterium]
MAYDEHLAEQIRNQLGLAVDVTEKKMFGGLAFLINGNMCIAASGQGGLLIRVDPKKTNKIISSNAGAEIMIMRGKEMLGWLRIRNRDLGEKELANWVKLSTSFARSLPKKEG